MVARRRSTRARRSRRIRRTRKAGRRRLMGTSGVIGPVTPAKLARASGMTSVTRTAIAAGKALFKRRKSAPGRARAVRLRTRTSEGTGSYAQWTQAYKQARFGRLTARKIDRLSTERLVYTHRLIGPFNDYGKQFMLNFQDTNGDQSYPLVLFELNSCNNVINGNIFTANPVYRLMQYSLTTSAAWVPINGQSTDGTTLQSGWILENASHLNTSTGAFPLEQAIHKWSSLDLELWGCRNKPTKFHICLCQFSEDVLPSYGNAGPAATEFWQSLIKHYTYSPLAKMEDGYNRKKMKILKQYKVNIDPTASFENDPDPHVKTMKLFYRFNRMSNFSWEFSNGIGQTIAEMSDADWKQKSNQNKTQLHPNARIYVMVRASNFTKITAPNPVDNTTNPSISWRLRTCWMANN